MKCPSGRVLTAAMSATLLFLSAATVRAADKKEVLQKAHAAYYSLKSNGLVEFQCNLTPDWGALLEAMRKTDPAAVDRAIKTLSQLQFTVSLGTAGSAKVTHTTVTPTNEEMAKGLNQVYGGMEQMVTGFFDTWSPFMVTSALPDADSEYQLEEQPEQWTLSYKEGNADVVTTLGKDLAIRALTVTTSEFKSTIQPQFTGSPKGLLLTGYQAEYYGKTPGETTKLQVSITYQNVNALQLPQQLSLRGSYGGDPFQIEVALSGCKATKQ